MIFERAFLFNGTDMVAAANIFDAKAFWMSCNMLAVDPQIKELDLDRDGIFVEVESEMEAVGLLTSMLPGGQTVFKKTQDCMLLVWISLRESLKCNDRPGPYLIAKVGM